MGFEAAAAFLPDLFAGAAEAAPEALAGAADVGAAAGEIAPFAAPADVLAAGGTDVLGLGGLGDTAALGAGAAATTDVGLGAAGAGAGLGADVGAVAPSVADASALGGGASFLPDLAGVDLGLGGGGAVPSLGTGAGAADTGAMAALGAPNIPPVGLGGGPAAPTIGATQVGDLTTQDLQTVLGGGSGVTGAPDVGGQQFASLGGTTTDVPVQDLGYTGLDPPTNLGGASTTNFGGGGLPNLPADTGTVPPADTGPTSVTPLSVTDYTQTPTPPIDQSIPTTNPDVAPRADAATYTAPAAGGGGGTTPPAGKAGGGGFDWYKAAGLGLAAAPLALTLARGQQNLPPQSQQAQGIDTNVGAAGQQLLQSAVSNTPMPGQQAMLTANRQAMINAARQQLFNEGVQNPQADSRWPAMVQQIDNQILQQQQTFITANLNAALSATGQASSGLTNIAQQQIALDNAYTQAIAGASGSVGRLVGQTGTRLL